MKYEQDAFFEVCEPHKDIKIFSDERIVEEAFKYFRKTGFPYRNLSIHQCMQEINKLAQLPQQSLINTNIAYSVADSYHRHRFHASAKNMSSPLESFNNDKRLRHALELQMKSGGKIPDGFFGMLGLVHGTQMCNHFRPGFACYMYRRFCEKRYTVLESCVGYGGAMVGYVASGVGGTFIGIDPNPVTQTANIRMSNDLDCNTEIYVFPVEDMETCRLWSRCDFAFTSPPYFSKEIYSFNDTQSWIRYKTGEEWQKGFLVPMMKLQFAALRKGKFNVINIADVNIDGVKYPLVEWTKKAAKDVGFVLESIEHYGLTRRFGANMKEERAIEPVLIFRKPQ